MKSKLSLAISLFWFIPTTAAFAHGTEEAGKANASFASTWIYLISFLFLLALIGYGYTMVLKGKLKKETKAESRKGKRQIKQQLNKRRRRFNMGNNSNESRRNQATSNPYKD